MSPLEVHPKVMFGSEDSSAIRQFAPEVRLQWASILHVHRHVVVEEIRLGEHLRAALAGILHYNNTPCSWSSALGML
jgi:hypothetical protein